MKQVLLLASAAMLAISAIAQPKAAHFNSKVRYAAQKPECATAYRGVDKALVMKSFTPSLNSHRVIRRAEGDVNPSGAVNARYFSAPFNTFYTGVSPDGYIFPFKGTDDQYVNWGFAGNYGYVPFANVSSNATSYEWSYEYFATPSDSVAEVVTSEDKNLYVPANFGVNFNTPVLTAFNGDDLSTYTDANVNTWYCGPALSTFGIKPSNVFSDGDPIPAEQDLYGVSTCPINVRQGKYQLLEFFSVYLKGDEYQQYFNANGCATEWEDQLKYDFKDQVDTITNVRFTSFVATLPEQNQAYLLDRVWAFAEYITKADVELTLKVCPIDAEGYILTDSIIGQGSYVLPASSTAQKLLPDFKVAAVDSEGFQLDTPVAISGSAAIIIEGLDNPNIVYCCLGQHAGTVYPTSENANRATYYSSNAYFGVTFDAVASQTKQELTNLDVIYPCSIIGFYTDDTRASIYRPYEYAIYYNIIFPAALNSDASTNHVVEMPVAGGEVAYDIEMVPNWNLADFVEAGLVTVEKNADWFDFTLTPEVIGEGEESYTINKFNITAPALAEVEERTGAIIVKGVGTDFAITVKQSAGNSGINEVGAAVAGAACYDLQGRRINEPAQGLYIKVNNGKATKHIAR